MKKEKRHTTPLSYLLLLIFVVHLGSTTLFSHAHVINGVIIVHSHINLGEHSHTIQNLQTIHLLSQILTFGDFQTTIIPEASSHPISTTSTPIPCHIVAHTPHILSPRAPPTSS